MRPPTFAADYDTLMRTAELVHRYVPSACISYNACYHMPGHRCRFV